MFVVALLGRYNEKIPMVNSTLSNIPAYISYRLYYLSLILVLVSEILFVELKYKLLRS